MDLLKIFKRKKSNLVELYKNTIGNCPFSVGQIVWKMYYNEPTEFIILNISFTLDSSTKYLLGTRTKPIIQMRYTARCLSDRFKDKDFGRDFGQDFDGYYATREDLILSFSCNVSENFGQ